MDRYVVIGNPVSHSLSPEIHASFAAATGEAIEYSALLAPLGAFAATARGFFDSGGRGANVTLPFKVEAFELAGISSDRARLAGAANFLAMRDGRLEADNTDGAGLIADLVRNLEIDLSHRRILLLGAGGAARGIVAPLLALSPESLVIANRSKDRARALCARFSALGPVTAAGLDDIPDRDYQLVLNATSTSTRGEPLDLAPHVLRPGVFAYDLAYGDGARPFVERARRAGARASDGLGMLIEQAAESFLLWRGRRPATGPVLTRLRARLP